METQRQNFEVGQQVDEDVTLGHPMRHGTAWSDWAAMSRAHGPARVRFLEVDAGVPDTLVEQATAPFRHPLAARARVIGAGISQRVAWIAYAAPAGPSLTRLAAAVEGGRVMLSERHALDLCARAARFLDALASGPPNGLLTLEDLHIERDGSFLHYGAGTVAVALASGCKAPWRQMLWAAPEAASDAFVPSREADSFSLALAIAAVLGGRIPSRDAIPSVLQRVSERYGADVARVLRTMTQARPELRIVDGASLLAALGRRPDARVPALSQPEQTSPPTSLRFDAPTPPSTGEVARWRDHEPTPSVAPDVVAAMMAGELAGDSVAALDAPTDAQVRIATPVSSDYVTLDEPEEAACSVDSRVLGKRAPPARDERVWLLREGSTELGPLSISELAGMYRKGVLLPSRRVAHVSDREFVSLSRMPWFATLDESAAAAPILDREWMECSNACMPRDLCGLLR